MILSNNMSAQGGSASGGKKTKIVATIGPASNSKEVLRELVINGVNVCRINFSHGDHESNGKVFEIIKELRVELKRPIGIMADLQGPRIRVGNTEKFSMEKGEFIFVADKKNTPEKELIIDSPGLVKELKVGDRILIEDGLMALKVVEKVEEDLAKAEVVNGGEIKPRKGVNVPDTQVGFGALTEKDEKDLEFSLKMDADFINLSFVSNAKEIEETREKMKKILGRETNLPQIVSKVERKEALKNLDEIIDASDVVMVARGDLGIEMEESKVVIYQKEIIKKCLIKVKPVIVATQMLDSMINNPIPTRAEVSDVSNAVIDHTDAVMLSGESANGKYPAKAVEMMNKIAIETENSPFDDTTACNSDKAIQSDYISIINSACCLVRNSNTKAIILFTESGYTARLMSNHRFEKLMIVATKNPKTYNQLSIVWGARAYLLKEEEYNDEFIASILEKCKNENKLKQGDKVVVVRGAAGKDVLPTIGMTEVK